MIITDLIREQVFQCAVMAGGGVLVMTLYSIFRNTCGLFTMTEVVKGALEVCFWICAAVLTSHFLYYCAYGRLSFHAAVSFAGGALLWKKIFCAIIDKIYMNLKTKQGINNKDGEKEKKQPVQGHQSGDRH